jgi:hypothetical protein
MGSRPVLLRAVRRVRAIYHLEREEYETNKKNLWSQEIRIRVMKILANSLEDRDVLKSVWFS